MEQKVNTNALEDLMPTQDSESHLLRWLAKSVGSPNIAISLWNGHHLTPESPSTRLTIRNRKALWKLLVNPELEFGNLYCSGDIDVSGDLVTFLETTYQALISRQNNSWIPSLISALNRRSPNTLSAAKNNIHHHYDIGNPFYALWLDKKAMQYTCAYFPEPDISLEQAQVAKMDHVCRKLCLKPGEKVVEAGCGWGGLARHMARHYNVHVTAYNISHEQVAFARQKAHEEGLDSKIKYIEDDYRNIRGNFNAFVSVGMLEHVGPEHYLQLGRTIDRCLADTGRGLIHTIGRNKPKPMNAWIEKRIFPGAHPPSLSEMMTIFEPQEFSLLDVENLRLHYAETLRHWLTRFEQTKEQIRHMFDAPFVRMWRLYLAGSIAAFTTGELQLFQVLFARPQHNKLPWSRAHLYAPTHQKNNA